MSPSLFLVLYTLSVPLFFLIDMVWLGVVANTFYRARLGHLMGEVVWGAAFLFYAIFLVGLTYFVTYPAVMKQSVFMALGLGALFGFFTYATYDLTNLATLRGWSLSLTIVDIVWGTCLGAFVAASATYGYLRFIA